MTTAKNASFPGFLNNYNIPLRPTSGPAIGSMGTGKLEGGLKKGGSGIPAIKKSK